MDTFAFIIHPIEPKRDLSRKYPLLGRLVSENVINLLSPFFPPVYISEISGIVSQSTGKEIKGWFVACPLTPARFLELPEKTVYRKIIQTGRLAEKLGAKILGLGAYTSAVGDSGITVAEALEVPVTTGNSYTVAVTIQALQKATRAVGIRCDQSTAAIVGASGTIGQLCAELLAQEVAELVLIGRQQKSIDELRERLEAGSSSVARIRTSTNKEHLRQAHIVLTATNSPRPIIEPEDVRPGCILCDVARPRDISPDVAAQRDDVLVIDGGIVKVPGPVDFHFNFGFPPGMAYACMAETMALALEGRFEDYTLGRRNTIARVKEIAEIAERHGFSLGGFRSFERPVTEEKIERVRYKAKRFSSEGIYN